MTDAKYNPRYTMYAKAHGRTEKQMLAYDKRRLPGACMMEFSFWIQAKWRHWAAERFPSKQVTSVLACLSNKDHADFDSWLAEKVGK